MTDTTTADAETDADTNEKGSEKETDWQAEAEKWKALSRKNEGTAKENAAAAKKLAEIEESSKSDLEKANARADAAEKLAAERELESARNRVALAKGLSATQAKRLVGNTQDELEADADELLADLKTTAKTAPTTDGQGKRGEAVGGDTKPDMSDLIRGLAKT
jgi:hypothetical protein